MKLLRNKILISIVVVAHDRKEFILEAIRSIEYQTADKTKFEVIVIKKFVDKEIDRVINSLGFVNIFTDENSLSMKIIKAAQHCTGDFISFLEDDDLFTENKIDEILKIILKYPEILYIHNWHTTIDLMGNKRGFSLGIAPRADIILDLKNAKYHKLTKILKYNPDFNLSSITIRKSLIDATSNALSSVDYLIDTFMFLTAIDSKKGLIYIGKDSLTLFRYYRKKGMTVVPENGKTKDSMITFIRTQYSAEQTLISKFREDKVRKLLASRISEDKVKLALLGYEFSSGLEASDFLILFLYAFASQKLYKFKVLLLGFYYLINRERAISIYYNSNLVKSHDHPDIQ